MSGGRNRARRTVQIGLNIVECQKLYVAEKAGIYVSATPKQILAAARDAARSMMKVGIDFAPARAARKYLPGLIGTHEHEVFCVAYLNNRHRLIAFEELFRGTIDGASVYTREVVKQALAHNAAAVILAHNHPSGVAEPSRADELITRRLREALALIDVRTLDHFIVAGDLITSFAEKGLL